jgi:hypothetical protein
VDGGLVLSSECSRAGFLVSRGLSPSGTPVGCVDTAGLLDREEPPSMPGKEKGTRNGEVSSVLMESDAGSIDTRHLIALPPMAITEDVPFSEVREFVRDCYRSELPPFLPPVHDL